MGPLKVKNEQNGAYGAQNDGNRALKKFAPQILQNAYIGPMRPLIRA